MHLMHGVRKELPLEKSSFSFFLPYSGYTDFRVGSIVRPTELRNFRGGSSAGNRGIFVAVVGVNGVTIKEKTAGHPAVKYFD